MNVPKLRFPGFEGNWAHKNLSLILSVNSGKDYKHLDSGDIPVYGTGGYMTSVNAYLSNENAIGIGRKGSIDKPQKLNAPFWTVDTLFYCTAINSTNLNFVYTLFNKINWKSFDESTGVPSLSKKTIEGISVGVPQVAEQEVIGTFFEVIDKKIQLQQEKINLLQEQKKGFLQKMFPKAGETQPEMRFDGFTGDWEQKNLGEHAKYRRGSFPQPYGNKEWYDGEGAMPFVQVVDVNEQLTLVDNTKQKISVLAQPKSVFVPKGKVVVTLQGSIGRVAITQYDSYVDRTLLIFEDYEKKTNEYFWAYTIQQKFEIEKQKAPGGTIKTITKEALSSFEVYLPNYEEQQKIGSFFKKLDDTIAIHKQKLDLYKEQKKGFIQKMFI